MTEQEGSVLAVLYEWLSWYLEALLQGTWAEDAVALARTASALALFAQP